MSTLLDSLKSGFDARPAAGVDAHGLGPARRAAMAAAVADGLPGARVEAWKYTSLRALSARAFAVEAATPVFDLQVLADIPSPRLVFVNGRYVSQHSALADLPEGVAITPLSQALAGGDAGAVAAMQAPFGRGDEVFARLNAALAVEGTRVAVEAGVDAGDALHLVFIGAPADTELAVHLRHVVSVGEGARLALVEHHLGAGTHRHLCNHLLRFDLGPGAQATHVRLQSEDAGASVFARTDVTQHEHSTYRRVDLELGAALSRHELNVKLQGEGASVIAGGLLLADGRRHLDTRLGIEHLARDTRCELPWRGLADQRGRAVFHGGITIHAGADGSDAALSNKNLLLSDSAEIDTQPVLVIHADEVKAAHGATVGRLDETALFYLRSRGIGAAQARAMLVQAFLREPLSILADARLREALGERIADRLDRKETP
ncbi:Fe-S cluster assembly protein SufD [Arenimonas sp. MALMAid1274]|uniref:Fe-S cluster assembly protein SufD n=1 Tax=Arenimonas sp. MALMAid1274 TaxID=3411630 RepID=UPI003BA24F49